LDSDFLIVGAGVVGLGCAVELLGRGAGVTVIDRGSCGGESSWAGGGILSPLCPWDYPEEVTRLTGRGAALFQAWATALQAATGIDPEYERSGMQVLPPFDRQLALRWCAAHNVRAEEGEPGAGLLLPDVAQVRNPRLLHALRSRVEALGGRIVERCAVREIITQENRVQKVQTACGEFGADSYIVAAGAWSKEVLGQHALHLDIRPMRGQMLLFKFDTPPLRHIVLQKDLYLIPRRDGHLLVGSTLEDAGFDKSITAAARDDLWRRAQQIVPPLRDMPLVRHWAGLRPGSPHNIPTIGRHPYLENLYLNSGHFRYGVTMAPASVEILLNDLSGKQQPFDVAPYRVGWGVR
jgi:glycine oxidase